MDAESVRATAYDQKFGFGVHAENTRERLSDLRPDSVKSSVRATANADALACLKAKTQNIFRTRQSQDIHEQKKSY